MERPLLIFGGCTTPTWLRDNVPPTMVGDGLFSRIVFIYADSSPREIAWVDEQVEELDYDYERKLADDLLSISELSGEVKISSEARALGRDWYHSLKVRCAAGEVDVLQRRQTQVVKLATVLAAAKGEVTSKGCIEISGPVFQEAIAQLELTNIQRQAIIDLLWKDKIASKLDRLLERIRIGEEVELRQMFQRVMAIMPIWEDFRKIVVSAREGGFVQTDQREDSKGKVILVRRLR